MCEINPRHTRIMRLECFTSDPNMTLEEFEQQVAERLLEAEQKLNADGKFRFHIHEEEEFYPLRWEPYTPPVCKLMHLAGLKADGSKELFRNLEGRRVDHFCIIS